MFKAKTKIRICLFLTLCLFYVVQITQAQPVFEIKTAAKINQMVEAADGSFMAAGIDYTTIHYFYGANVSASGEINWEKRYSEGNGTAAANDMIKTTDGNFLLVGETSKSGSGLDLQIFLVKIQPNGDTLWTRQYGDSKKDGATSVVNSADGGYVITGYYNKQTLASEMFLMKVDQNGQQVWFKTYTFSSEITPTQLLALTNDNYYVAGSQVNIGTGNYTDAFLLKLNSTGDTTWRKTYNVGTDDFANALIASNDGNYFLAGIYFALNFSTYDGNFIYKLDPDGNVIWEKMYGRTLSVNQFAGIKDLHQLPDSSLLAAGLMTNRDGGSETDNAMIMQLSSSGDSLWTFTKNPGEDDGFLGLTITSDDKLLAWGHAHAIGYMYKGIDFCMMENPGIKMTDTMLTATFDILYEPNYTGQYWTFGDGDSANWASPSNTYPNSGTYNVCLTVSNSCASIEYCQDFDIVCIQTSFAYQVLNDNNLTVNFVDSTKNAGSRQWDFGDGTTDTSATPSHSYSAAGSYVVCLKVTNSCGTDSLCTNVEVNQPSCNNIVKKTFGDTKYDNGKAIIESQDCGAFVTGMSQDAFSNPHVYFAKLDANGDTVVSSKPGALNAYGEDIFQLMDGHIIIAGFSYGSPDGYLLKLNQSGALIWEKSIGGTGSDGFYGVIETPENHIIAVGYTDSYGSGDKDMYMVKTDSTGNEIWYKTYGASGWDEIYDVKLSSDGNYLISGYQDKDAVVMKLDTAGAVLWTSKFGESFSDYAYSIVEAGNFIYVAGKTGETASKYNQYMMKIKSNTGDTVKSVRVGVGFYNDALNSVVSIGDYLYWGGFTRADWDDMYLAKTDASLNILWEKTISNPFGLTTGNDYINSLSKTSDDRLLGFGAVTNNTNGILDEFYFLKADTLGNYCNEITSSFTNDTITKGVPATFQNSTSGTSGVSYMWFVDGVQKSTSENLTHTFQAARNYVVRLESYNDSCSNIFEKVVTVNMPTELFGSNAIGSTVKIYPNPSNGSIKLNLGNYSSGTIRIYDLPGKELFAHDFTNDMSGYAFQLPPGIYFIKVSNKSGTEFSGHKVIVY